MPAIVIGYLIGTIIGFFLKLAFMILGVVLRGVWWLLDALMHLVVREEATVLPMPMPQIVPQYGRVLGEDAFGCVMGEDWNDDDRGGNGPETPEPGPPRHGIAIPPQRLTDTREQRKYGTKIQDRDSDISMEAVYAVPKTNVHTRTRRTGSGDR